MHQYAYLINTVFHRPSFQMVCPLTGVELAHSRLPPDQRNTPCIADDQSINIRTQVFFSSCCSGLGNFVLARLATEWLRFLEDPSAYHDAQGNDSILLLSINSCTRAISYSRHHFSSLGCDRLSLFVVKDRCIHVLNCGSKGLSSIRSHPLQRETLEMEGKKQRC